MKQNLSIAEKYRRSGNFSGALPLYKEIIQEFPENADAYQGAAYCFYYLHQWDDAIEYSDKAIELDSNLAVAHTIRAYVLNIYGDKSKSRNEARVAFELDSNSPDVLCCYGTMLVFDGEFDSAIQMLENAVRIDPSIYVAHNNLAFAYSQQNNRKKQLHHLGFMFRLKPSIRNAIGYLGALSGAYALPLSVILFLIMCSAYLYKIKLLLVLPLLVIVLGIISFFVITIKGQWKEALRILIGLLIIGSATIFIYFNI